MIDVGHLTYRYGRHVALSDFSLTVPDGGLHALLGRNGSGKTTLLQLIMGLRKVQTGTVRIMGKDIDVLRNDDRGRVGYIAEGQALPGWMQLQQLEAYLAPLYPAWDVALVRDLHEQFELDPTRKISALSRGEQMKAALLCALAPRPRLLIMDEPFTGMDALVKDDLVRGLLQSSGEEGWTVLVCSHDIGELELLADTVSLIDYGQLRLSVSMDELRSRFHKVDVMAPLGQAMKMRNEWLGAEHTNTHATFIVDDNAAGLQERIATQLPPGTRIDIRGASLREVFVALTRRVKQRREEAA